MILKHACLLHAFDHLIFLSVLNVLAGVLWEFIWCQGGSDIPKTMAEYDKTNEFSQFLINFRVNLPKN